MTDGFNARRAGRMGVALGLLLCIASPASAALLYYDGFDYPATPAPQQLIGKTNTEYSKTWSQPSLPNNNRQTIQSGNLTYDGFPDPTPGSNSVLDPRGSAAQNGHARIDIPDAPYTSGSLFFSMLIKATTWANLNYALSTNDANLGGGWLGGFHYGQGTEPASLVPPFALQLKTLRHADSTLAPTANQPQQYHLGVVKSAGSGVNGPRTWTTETFDLNETVFVVGEYKFNTGSNTDDEVRLWVNPTPGDESQWNSPDVIGPAGQPDVNPAEIKSFYFAANTFTPGNFQIDELRIGDTFASVINVPEPSTLVLLTLAALCCGVRRRGGC